MANIEDPQIRKRIYELLAEGKPMTMLQVEHSLAEADNAERHTLRSPVGYAWRWLQDGELIKKVKRIEKIHGEPTGDNSGQLFTVVDSNVKKFDDVVYESDAIAKNAAIRKLQTNRARNAVLIGWLTAKGYDIPAPESGEEGYEA